MISYVLRWILTKIDHELSDDEDLNQNMRVFLKKILSAHPEISNKMKLGTYLDLLTADDRPTRDFLLIKLRDKTKTRGFHNRVKTYIKKSALFVYDDNFLFEVLQWDESEIARQLSIIAHYQYSKITYNELINANWTRKNKDELSPNVMRMIDRFNSLYGWVIEEILAYDKSSHRALRLEKFILIAQELRKLRNYNDFLNIIVALNSLPMRNMHKTFRKLKKDTLLIFRELTEVCSCGSNYIRLRDEIEKSSGQPCVPYLGLYLTDLAFIEEGPRYILESGELNLNKIQRVGRVIERVMKYQKFQYTFFPIMKLSFLNSPICMEESKLIDLAEKLEPTFRLSPCKSLFKRPTTNDSRKFTLNPCSKGVEVVINEEERNRLSIEMLDDNYFKKPDK